MRRPAIVLVLTALLFGGAVSGCKKLGIGGGSSADEALVEAAKSGDIAAATKALGDGANVNFKAPGSEEAGDQGHTPLHYAAERGNTEMVGFLLDKGAQIDSRNDLGNTPLLLAINFTKTDTVKLLLKRGADINVRNKDGKGAIAHAEKGRPSKATLELLAIVKAAGAQK